MFSKIFSCGIRGVEGYPVWVETDVSSGLPGFTMVGYLGEEVREAQERVRTALRNSGFSLPPRRITVNLSPAGVRKEGTAFDLAMAASVLCCLGETPLSATEGSAFFGELGLDGRIKPVKGILPRVYCVKKEGFRRCYLPEKNVREGTVVEGMEIIGVRDLGELARVLKWPETARKRFFDPSLFEPAGRTQEGESRQRRLDFADIAGQVVVKRAMEVAAAGNHSILLIGPAGTGKTMAARRLPGILPAMTVEERIQVSKVYSICGLLEEDSPLLAERPFRAPHHSATAQALTGGGRNPRPGEISLASKGILFLDELTEFPGRILDLLRQPLEERQITVSRLNGALKFPADFLLVCAMNPCRCGHYPDRELCTCTEAQIHRYLGRISGPFLDRIDLGVDVPLVPYEELRASNSASESSAGESSSDMRKRVEKARNVQEKRFIGLPIQCNSEMGGREIAAFCGLDQEEEKFLQAVYRGYGFSARAFEKILKVARTIADLEGAEHIDRVHLSEAVSYRSFEKTYWGFQS